LCFACEMPGPEVWGVDDALAARARRIGARTEGPQVSDGAWEVLLGQRRGHVPLSEVRRALRALERAASDLCARLQCEAVSVDESDEKDTTRKE
jgi:hypothetical protein